MENIEKYMKKCFSLAKKGMGKVSPNPMVGAVVLDKNGEFISCGYHKKYGQAHAEVNALNLAGEKAKDGSIIVNLEPCSHYGKTPPCADLIIKYGIKNLYVAMQDPNPLVSGKGLEKCKNAGINVFQNILKDEALKINEIFIKNQTKKEPFIAIKTATTLDGKIATSTYSSKWITSEKSRYQVQKLRLKYDAIMTGSNTVLQDNPSLTCRISKQKKLTRIIIDSKLSLTPDKKVFTNDGCKIFIAIDEKIDDKKLKKFPKHINFIKCPLKNKKIDLKFLTKELYNQGIMSILVESGCGLNSAIIKENLADKLYLFQAPKILGDNTGITWVDGFNIKNMNNSKLLKLDFSKKFGDDILSVYYFL